MCVDLSLDTLSSRFGGTVGVVAHIRLLCLEFCVSLIFVQGRDLMK